MVCCRDGFRYVDIAGSVREKVQILSYYRINYNVFFIANPSDLVVLLILKSFYSFQTESLFFSYSNTVHVFQ